MNANDLIWWAPPAARTAVPKRFPDPIHFCPTAVRAVPTVRQSLDPMALGTCRYCGEKLP